ncbi:MAG: DUF1002 domain-containing protein [Aerococcaceae bacterium]|nr:DUF1002 domain-containing protein [Aerococcaceae bacterium]
MKKTRKLPLLALAASLAITPLSALVMNQSAYAVQVAQAERLVSLGGSLTAQQAEQTKQLLGATDVTADRTIYVDGNTINRFLQDGSNSATTVYSSALIEKQPAGFGVQVQIVTPQNITLVKPVTYQNAAITSGAKDVLIKIATVTPVTGEGALAGVYALLEKSGVQIDPKAVKVAEKEIKIVEQVKQTAPVNDNQVNQIISDIKKEVTVNVTNNTEVNVTQIVQNVVNNQTEINLTEENVKELEEFASDFAKTEAAQDENTIEQLEKSIDLNLDRPWVDVLASIEEKKSVEDLLQMGSPDYSAAEYHPIIQAFFNKFYQIAQEGGRIETLYSHTFIAEKMLPNLSAESKRALNQLRVYLYQYAENEEPQRKAIYESAGLPYKTLRDSWTDQLNWASAFQYGAPELNEVIQKAALSSGLAPEVFVYHLSQTDHFIRIEARFDAIVDATLVGTHQYNVAIEELSYLDAVAGTFISAPLTFDFQQAYGVPVENGYVPTVAIPLDLRLEGATITESESSSESAPAEETSETTSETETPTEPATPEESESSSGE